MRQGPFSSSNNPNYGSRWNVSVAHAQCGARQVPRTPPYPLPCLSPERPPQTSLGALLCIILPATRCVSTPRQSRPISPAMGERKHKILWEVIRLRARGEYIGTVSAPDQQAAFKAAITAFE